MAAVKKVKKLTKEVLPEKSLRKAKLKLKKIGKGIAEVKVPQKPLKKELKKIAKKARRVPSNLRFAVLVTIGVFWAEFLKQLFVVGFRFLPIEVSTTIGALIAAVLATIIGLFVLESWPRIKAYLR